MAEDKQCKYQQCNWCQMSSECQIYQENQHLLARIDELEKDNQALTKSVVTFGTTIKQKEKLWKHLESRFVEVCKTCNDDEKAHCLMFPEYCEGQCTEIVDLFALLDKATDNGKVQ